MRRHCARQLGGILEGAGFRIRYHSFGPARVNLVADIGNSKQTRRRCASLATSTWYRSVLHIGRWIRLPRTRMRGKLYGRGTSDMKAAWRLSWSRQLNLAP